MTVIPFDTHKAINDLQEAGIDAKVDLCGSDDCPLIISRRDRWMGD